jgi:hypothetical protein
MKSGISDVSREMSLFVSCFWLNKGEGELRVST